MGSPAHHAISARHCRFVSPLQPVTAIHSARREPWSGRKRPRIASSLLISGLYWRSKQAAGKKGDSGKKVADGGIFLFRNWQLGWVGYPSCASADALPLPSVAIISPFPSTITCICCTQPALERNGLEDALPVPMWSWVPGKEDLCSPALRTELFFPFGQAEGMNVTMLFWLHFLLLPASGKLRSARHCLAAPPRPRPS
ncbi:hypothetical protein V8C34DRAFT_321264 [Trichoderma compactum]